MSVAVMCRSVLRWALLGVPLCQVAMADADTPPQNLDQLLEEVVVGSRLPQSQGASITVITAEDIQQRGFASVSDVLRSVGENSGGGFDQQFGPLKSFTPAAAALNLRDLGYGRQLILLDGHRLPMYPTAFGGADNFVDISSIPLVAIERIEVLTEGASAVYGSDAMSGVVNIVLKSQAPNELGLQRSGTTQGGGDQQRWQLTVGAQYDSGGLLLMAEHQQQKAMWYAQRERSRYDRLGGPNGAGPGVFSDYGYPGAYTDSFFPGGNYQTAAPCVDSYVSPGTDPLGYCRFNRAPYRQLRPDQTADMVTAKWHVDIAPALQLRSTTVLRHDRQRMSSDPLAINTALDLGIFPSQPNAVSFQRRIVEQGGAITEFDTRAYFVVFGLHGTTSSTWTWDVDVQAARQRVQKQESGLGLISAWTDAVNGDTDFNGDGSNDPVDLAQPIPQYIADALNYRATSKAISRLEAVNIQAAGEVASLAAGPLRLALVGEYVREGYRDQYDPALVARQVITNSATNTTGERAHAAVGMEIQWPISTALRLNFADRFDRYQYAGSTVSANSPRLVLDYTPLSAWTLRGSAGRTFRVPDIQRVFAKDLSAYVLAVDTVQCKADGGSGRGDAAYASCVTPTFVGLTTRGNPALQAETGWTYLLGSEWRVASRWQTSLEYFFIDLKWLVQTPNPQQVLDDHAASGAYAGQVIDFNSGTCPFTQHCLLLRPINIARKKTSGVDWKLSGAVPTALGTWSMDLAVSYLLSVRMQEGQTSAEVDVLASGQLDEATRVKGSVEFGWQRDAWRATLYVNYVGPFTPYLTTAQDRLASFVSANVTASYAFSTDTLLRVGVTNVMNRQPPVATYLGNSSWPFYHQQFHNLEGRGWVAELRQKF